MLQVLMLLGISLIIMFWVVFFSHNKSEIKEYERLKKLLDQDKSRYVVQFYVNGHGCKETKPFEPKITGYGLIPSKEQAINILQDSYRRGYFLDKDGITYPVSNIVSAQIWEIKWTN